MDGAVLLVTALADAPADLESAYEEFTATMANREESGREELTVAGQPGLRCTVQHRSDKTKLTSGVVLFTLEGTTYIFALTCKEKSFEQYGEIWQTILTSVAPAAEAQG